jgi:starvation-inducible DNA-binding protein
MQHGTQKHGGNGNRPAQANAAASPVKVEYPAEIQAYGTLARYPLGLADDVRAASVELLNLTLADTAVIRDMYKKHHWQASGPTFYQLHLLFDKHYAEQATLIDLLAERVQTLGGIAIAMAHDIAEMTRVPRPPRGREDVSAQLSRLLSAHEQILVEARVAARKTEEAGDDGTNDLLVSDVIRINEMQVWFLSEHLVNIPLVRGKEPGTSP